MTRNEACKKVFLIADTNSGVISPHLFVACLEELGLIKFDEELKDSPLLIIREQIINNFKQPMQKADNIVNALYAAGYKIVRKD